MVIAFIGTRTPANLPIAQVNLYTRLARFMAQQGHDIVTGAAPGLDQVAANTALRQGATVHLFLPWPAFERTWVSQARKEHGQRVVVHQPPADPPAKWTRSVYDLHPASHNLSRWALALLLRDYPIVETAQAVVALPSGKQDRGGTQHAMRIAAHLNRTLWDLSRREVRESLEKQMARLKQ